MPPVQTRQSTPVEISLNEVEARILGVLIEKELSTPDYYPLTLNALVNACNQRTNRDPVMNLDETAVSDALDRLRKDRLVWQVKTQGNRALKYQHNLRDATGLSNESLALLCELLLRGPQTAGELRTRTARMAKFTGVPAVDYALKKLAEHGKGPFVRLLPRKPGQKESRWVHLLGDADVNAPEIAADKEEAGRSMEPSRIEALEARVASLEGKLEKLTMAFQDFKKSFE